METNVRETKDTNVQAASGAPETPAIVSSAKKTIKSVTDVLGDGQLHFHDDLEKVSLQQLLDVPFVILEVKFIEGWQSQFGDSDFCLIRGTLEETGVGKEFTTLCGGEVVLKRVKQLIAKRAIPILATFKMVAGVSFNYYTIV
jgi:hypothetical protein